jgi:transcriptional regulator with XRE-family HTH domain
VDDRTVGLVLRALRRRRGWRQSDLATRARCSQSVVSQVERGHLVGTSVDLLRRLFGALDARLQLAPSWRGADLERLVDADHAAIVAALVRRLERAGWEALVEVTYAIGGERGSIDVLGIRPDIRAALTCEVKSDIPAAEAVARKLDEKGRLTPAIVRARLGWTPIVVGVALILPEGRRLRRLLNGQAASIARAYPIVSRRVASWLREPNRPLAATWFLSDIAARNARRVRKVPRVRLADAAARGNALPSVDSEEDEPPRRILR